MAPPPESATEAGRPLVLVVDDEPIVRRLMTAALSGCFRVLGAADGREALALVELMGADIAVVVTDVRMPDVDGLALARALSARARPPGILFISAFTAELPGPCLEKPFLAEHLLTAVQHLLAGYQEPRMV